MAQNSWKRIEKSRWSQLWCCTTIHFCVQNAWPRAQLFFSETRVHTYNINYNTYYFMWGFALIFPHFAIETPPSDFGEEIIFFRNGISTPNRGNKNLMEILACWQDRNVYFVWFWMNIIRRSELRLVSNASVKNKIYVSIRSSNELCLLFHFEKSL